MKVDFVRFRKSISFAALAFLALHITLGLYLTFSGARYIEEGGSVFKMYQRFLHTGPFFSEQAIKSTTRLQASYLREKGWKDIRVVEDRLKNYQAGPWRMHELLQRDYVRHHCNVLYRTTEKMTSPHLKKLNDYLVNIYGLQDADSIRLHYTLEEYQRVEDTTIVSTFFYIQYSPGDVK